MNEKKIRDAIKIVRQELANLTTKGSSETKNLTHAIQSLENVDIFVRDYIRSRQK